MCLALWKGDLQNWGKNLEMSNYLSTKKTEKLNDTALGKQVVQNMEDNRSTPRDSAVNNRNYVN